MAVDGAMAQDVTDQIKQARAQLARHQFDAAVTTLDVALRKSPADAEANILRGMLCVGQKCYADAVQYLRRAVTADPSDGNAWMILGAALFETGDQVGALSVLENACELVPRMPSAWYNLGRTYKLVGRFADARIALQRALSLESTNAKARLTLADIEVAVGNVAAGVAHYRKLLQSEPENPRAWFGLANLKTYVFDVADVVCLRQAAAQSGISTGARILLGFALATALEDQGDYAGAWSVLQEANAREHKCHPWDRYRYRDNISQLISVFADVPAQAPSCERGREVIFIVSLPRSGSTLVEQILASHPDVNGANEINVLSTIIAEESSRRHAQVVDWIPHAKASDWARLGEEYLERTLRFRTQHRYFTDKSLGTWEFLGLVRQMLPGAHFIHCHRDPLENCFSCYRQWFNQGCNFSNNLEDLASYYADYWRLMEFWQARGSSDIFDLSYEALLIDSEAIIRRLLAFCDLSYDAACLTPERSGRVVTSTASAAQVRQPIHNDTPKALRYGALLDPLREHLREYGLM